MERFMISGISSDGLPMFDRKKVFTAQGEYTDMSFSYITLLPGKRVPAEGLGRHAEDEYSIFLEGEAYTESGDFKGTLKAGDATLIPKGETHWCENRTDKPCILACVMLK